MPEEGNVSRPPVARAVDNDRIVDRHINVIRLHRFDSDVFGRACIAGARCGHAADLLLFARFQIARHFGLLAQGLNRELDVVGLGEKGFTELVGPIQLLVHHRQHLGYRRQSLDAWIPRLLLHGALERRTLEVRVLLDPTRRERHLKRIGRCRQHLRQQWIGIERNRRNQLLDLLLGERRLLLLRRLLLRWRLLRRWQLLRGRLFGRLLRLDRYGPIRACQPDPYRYREAEFTCRTPSRHEGTPLRLSPPRRRTPQSILCICNAILHARFPICLFYGTRVSCFTEHMCAAAIS